MGQPSNREALAHRFAGWHAQAERCHRLLRRLVDDAEEVTAPGDGTVTVRVRYAEWRAACVEAMQPAPEPISPPTQTT